MYITANHLPRGRVLVQIEPTVSNVTLETHQCPLTDHTSCLKRDRLSLSRNLSCPVQRFFVPGGHPKFSASTIYNTYFQLNQKHILGRGRLSRPSLHWYKRWSRGPEAFRTTGGLFVAHPVHETNINLNTFQASKFPSVTSTISTRNRPNFLTFVRDSKFIKNYPNCYWIGPKYFDRKNIRISMYSPFRNNLFETIINRIDTSL